MQNFIKNYTFAIDNTSNGKFMGLFGLKLGNKKYKRAEVWYKIHSEFWRKGYATEVSKRLIKCGFEDFNLHRIEAGVAIENENSIRVLEKSGMTYEGIRRKILPIRGKWIDNYEYAILENDPRDY